MALIPSRRCGFRHGCSRQFPVKSELKSRVSNPDFRQSPTRNDVSKWQIQTTISTSRDLPGVPLTDELIELLNLWQRLDQDDKAAILNVMRTSIPKS